VAKIDSDGKQLLVNRKPSIPVRPAVAGAVALSSMVTLLPASPAAAETGPGTPPPATAAPSFDDLTSLVPELTGPAAAPLPVNRLVVFGDSVANHQSCHCENFISRYATLVSDRRTVDVTNLAGDNQNTADVLRVLETPAATTAVSDADDVVFVAGANDFSHSFARVGHGRANARSFRTVARRVGANLTEAARDVRQLSPSAHVIMFGYWNAFKDGNVAAETYSRRQRNAAAAATRAANNAIRHAAEHTGSTYVPTRDPFTAQHNLTTLLAADGDHPSAAGNDVLARALDAAVWVK
jgi:lysophospholipase L1-like esterase